MGMISDNKNASEASEVIRINKGLISTKQQSLLNNSIQSKKFKDS
jgi:hypothetical protein